MAVRLFGATLEGVDAVLIEIEVDLLRRLPSVTIVGLAASAVKESAERIRSAITSSDLAFPRSRVVVNLAPADLPKDGTAFDLPLALGILAADEVLPLERLEEVLVVGELGLNGRLRPIRGALSIALLARELGKTLILPAQSARQAALVPGVRVFAAEYLAEVVAHVRGDSTLAEAKAVAPVLPERTVDLAEVRGQPLARRALEIAAAGAHHLLLVGPPGCGKSMLARRLATILPAPTFAESLETTRVHAAAGLLGPDGGLLGHRPFRAPHHSVTVAGLIGDRRLRPGEVSLAHHGILFLDEANEFARNALEVLREPLEDGHVRLTRARGSVRYPAAITLVMAANPCPCGHYGSLRPCICTDGQRATYRRRLSGPILDRIDLHVGLRQIRPSELLTCGASESSATVRARVVAARQRRTSRGQQLPNGRLSASEAIELAMTVDARELLRSGAERHRLSGRAAVRLLKVARTIADLADHDVVDVPHVEEALGFRPALDA